MTQKTYLVAVVDDDNSVRKAISRLLRSAGFEARPFGSGVEFLESLSTDLPDCAIVDLHMPNMNGLEVQARISASDLHVPVILITAHDAPGVRERAITAGVAAYLAKPLAEEALLDSIITAVHQRGDVNHH